MSLYYTPQRTKNMYDPNDTEPFKISRSKIELFITCPRCFYLDRRMGVGRPPSFPFTLNSAVDTLLKKEFDTYRIKGAVHPLIQKYGIDAKPALHEDLDKWRANFTGIQYLHEPTNLLITGAIDDLWQNSKGEYIVVDYKATAKDKEIHELNEEWHDSYRRQMEIYQWLLRRNNYPVSSTGYFVYCNGKADKAAFNGKLEFETTLIPYIGSDHWIESAITQIHKCLNSASIPASSPECDYCAYREAVQEAGK